MYISWSLFILVVSTAGAADPMAEIFFSGCVRKAGRNDQNWLRKNYAWLRQRTILLHYYEVQIFALEKADLTGCTRRWFTQT